MSKKQRKCLYYAFLSVLVLTIILLPILVFGAWIYEQNFNTLSDGSLSSQDGWVEYSAYGGSGTNSVGSAYAIEGLKGANVYKPSGTGYYGVEKVFPTPLSKGHATFWLQTDTYNIVSFFSNSNDPAFYTFYTIYLGYYGQNEIFIPDTTGCYNPVGTNKYRVNFEFDTGQVRVRCIKADETFSPWSDWTVFYAGSNDIQKIRVWAGAAPAGFNFDLIQFGEPPIGPTTEIMAWNVGGFGRPWNYFSESTENVNPWFTHWLVENSIVDFSGNIVDYGTSTTSPEYSDSAENPLPASTQNIITKNNILKRGTTYYARSRLFGPASDCYAPNWNCFKNEIAVGDWLEFSTLPDYDPGAIPDPYPWFSTSSFITDDYLAEKCDGTSTFCFIYSSKVRDFFAPFANFSLAIRGFTANLGEIIDASTTKYFLSMTASLTDIFSMRIPIPILILAEISFILGFFALKAVIRLIRGG